MKNLLYLLLLTPLLYSCQQYNKPPYDEKEEKLRKYPDTLKMLMIDSLWQKRDSLTYLRFKNVEQIYLVETDSIPNWIDKVDKLNVLFGSNNRSQIRCIPENFYKLKNIERIYLPRNKITKLSSKFYTLNHLKVINFEKSQISKISDSIKDFKNLRSLNLSNNPIIIIPNKVCQLPKLESLVLENTKISELPKCLGTLPNIDWINVSGTQLKEFPMEILNAPKLKTIHAKGLKLTNYQEVKAICEKRNITFYYDEK